MRLEKNRAIIIDVIRIAVAQIEKDMDGLLTRTENLNIFTFSSVSQSRKIKCFNWQKL